MKRIAIVGGGIAGLAAAYELELARLRGAEIDWHLYEAGDRLGGIVSTTRRSGFVLEDGPDGWVTDKPWARDLAMELGLKDELIVCNEATKKTYILIREPGEAGKLQPMPARMRMMVPEDLSTLEGSPLFSDAARAAYAVELARAEELKASAPSEDESVASFVLRHFGDEVLEKIGAPLLSGVFGGDVKTLSVRAVMAPFVAMEREHGSLILALQKKAKERGERTPSPTFTSLRNGMGSLAEAIVAKLPEERLHLQREALSLKREGKLWCLKTSTPTSSGKSKRHFQHVMIAAPIDAARKLLEPLDAEAAALVPADASSAVLATFAWSGEAAKALSVPDGFGFLVPAGSKESRLLACTFVDRKFPDRAPEGGRVVRAFYGGKTADTMAKEDDATVAAEAFSELTAIFGTLPGPDANLTTVRRWPRSLPQYPVGHLERMADLDQRVAKLGGLTLLGNGYRGVGVPDLIRWSREAARSLIPA
jgi:oxygen-dependent protoporphyrinogen oxidase